VSCSPSDNSLSFPSDLSSNQHLAADTVVRIKGHPARSQVLRTIIFNGDRSLRPSLWDVMILILVVHNDSAFYNLLNRQCYWFADTIFGSLEKWAANHNNGTVVTSEKRSAKWGMRRGSTGSRGIVTIHRRNALHIDKIWADFEEEREAMTHQKDEYERARTEEIEKTRQLADEVRELKQCQLELKSKVCECQILPNMQHRRCHSIHDIHRSSRRISYSLSDVPQRRRSY